jgi:hypothetical protein
MRKLVRSDIRGPRLYAGMREDMRKRIIELKKHRRVSVGPLVTLVFENRDTLIFQIEEMLRAEQLEAEAKILEEIEVYNSLIPDPGELSATLLIEITEQAEIRPTLNRLVGLDEHVILEGGGARARAVFEEGRQEDARIAAVQYIRFRLPEALAGALARGEPVRLIVDHPAYQHVIELGEATRAELARDLAPD